MDDPFCTCDWWRTEHTHCPVCGIAEWPDEEHECPPGFRGEGPQGIDSPFPGRGHTMVTTPTDAGAR